MFGLQIKYLSFFFGLISILSFFNIIYSYYFNLYLNLDTYYLSLFLSSALAILFYSLKISLKKTSIFQKILTVFLGYILLPLILSIPFYLSIYNLTFINSFFEAVSGFTSTGFTIFENIKNIDQSLILWRSTIQWIGGLYFLFSIIYLIDIYDENFKKTLTNFFSFNTSEIFKQAIKVFFIYSGITLVKTDYNLSLFFLFLTIIGGSIMSNTSGIKLCRFYILLKITSAEIIRLISPNSIINKTIFSSENKITDEGIKISFLIFISFFLSLFILSCFLVLDEIDFESSFKLSILALTNTVNSEMFSLPNLNFENMLTSSKISLIIFMIIGKIELISIFLIFKKIFFKD